MSSTSSNSSEDSINLPENGAKLEFLEKEPEQVHGLDDYIQMGKYVLLVCLAAELLILPQVSSMFYMMYAGIDFFLRLQNS